MPTDIFPEESSLDPLKDELRPPPNVRLHEVPRGETVFVGMEGIPLKVFLKSVQTNNLVGAKDFVANCIRTGETLAVYLEKPQLAYAALKLVLTYIAARKPSPVPISDASPQKEVKAAVETQMALWLDARRAIKRCGGPKALAPFLKNAETAKLKLENEDNQKIYRAIQHQLDLEQWIHLSLKGAKRTPVTQFPSNPLDLLQVSEFPRQKMFHREHRGNWEGTFCSHAISAAIADTQQFFKDQLDNTKSVNWIDKIIDIAPAETSFSVGSRLSLLTPFEFFLNYQECDINVYTNGFKLSKPISDSSNTEESLCMVLNPDMTEWNLYCDFIHEQIHYRAAPFFEQYKREAIKEQGETIHSLEWSRMIAFEEAVTEIIRREVVRINFDYRKDLNGRPPNLTEQKKLDEFVYPHEIGALKKTVRELSYPDLSAFLSAYFSKNSFEKLSKKLTREGIDFHAFLLKLAINNPEITGGIFGLFFKYLAKSELKAYTRRQKQNNPHPKP